MKYIKLFESFNEDKPTLDLATTTLKDTIFKHEPKENTKYSKKGYIRFYDSYSSTVLYISKNNIILIYSGLNSHKMDQEDKLKYDGKADGLLKAIQQAYNFCRFKNEHYPEPGTTYSLKDGHSIKKQQDK